MTQNRNKNNHCKTSITKTHSTTTENEREYAATKGTTYGEGGLVSFPDPNNPSADRLQYLARERRVWGFERG